MTLHVIPSDDLVITEIDDRISIVLKQRVQIFRYLKKLIDDHEYELIFNSQLAEEEHLVF